MPGAASPATATDPASAAVASSATTSASATTVMPVKVPVEDTLEPASLDNARLPDGSALPKGKRSK